MASGDPRPKDLSVLQIDRAQKETIDAPRRPRAKALLGIAAALAAAILLAVAGVRYFGNSVQVGVARPQVEASILHDAHWPAGGNRRGAAQLSVGYRSDVRLLPFLLHREVLLSQKACPRCRTGRSAMVGMGHVR